MAVLANGGRVRATSCAMLVDCDLESHGCHAHTAWVGAPPQARHCGGGGSRGTPPKPAPKNLRERFTALRNLRPFVRERWPAGAPLLLADLTLRSVRAVADCNSVRRQADYRSEVVALLRTGVTFDSLGATLASGEFNRLGFWLGCEFGLALLLDLFGRLVSLIAWRAVRGECSIGDLTFLCADECQKIAVARAYKRDAQLRILDEPIAALGARSEWEVFERFKELSAGKKTAELTSQRSSIVRMADRIVVLESGRIEEVRTHV